MAKPLNNELVKKHPLLAFFLIEIKTNRVYADLDFEICEDKVFIFVTPDKGHSNEERSLSVMETVAPLVNEWGFVVDPLFRNSSDGDRIDGIRIRL